MQEILSKLKLAVAILVLAVIIAVAVIVMNIVPTVQNIMKLNEDYAAQTIVLSEKQKELEDLQLTIKKQEDLSDIEKASYCAQNNVKYLMSHDEIGNMDGTRLIAKLMSSMLHLKEGITLNEEEAKRIQQIQKLWNCSAEEAYEKVVNQKSEMLSNKLATMFQTGELDKYDLNINDNMQNKDEIRRKFEQEIIKPLGISPDLGITYDKIIANFEKANSIISNIK